MNNGFLLIKEKIIAYSSRGGKWLLTAENKVKKFKFKTVKKYIVKKYKKFSKMISDTWKPLIIGVPSFLLCYYVIGALISENIDVSKFEKNSNIEAENSQTLEIMQQILKREVDEHIWTLNLPLIFPARVLDNMPNFQRGVLQSVRDVTATVKKYSLLDEAQKKSLQKASKLLNYPLDVWLLSRKSTFNIAPSSNSQYRKARKEFEKINKNGKIFLTDDDLRNFLRNLADNLQKLMAKNEERVREFSSNYIDFRADNLFYIAKGYAFGLWQISEAAVFDFKENILAADAYADWTLMTANLRKTAEFKPLIVRNCRPDSVVAPNHLLVQNYYLALARAQAEKILNMLGKADNAAAD